MKNNKLEFRLGMLSAVMGIVSLPLFAFWEKESILYVSPLRYPIILEAMQAIISMIFLSVLADRYPKLTCVPLGFRSFVIGISYFLQEKCVRRIIRSDIIDSYLGIELSFLMSFVMILILYCILLRKRRKCNVILASVITALSFRIIYFRLSDIIQILFGMGIGETLNNLKMSSSLILTLFAEVIMIMDILMISWKRVK